MLPFTLLAPRPGLFVNLVLLNGKHFYLVILNSVGSPYMVNITYLLNPSLFYRKVTLGYPLKNLIHNSLSWTNCLIFVQSIPLQSKPSLILLSQVFLSRALGLLSYICASCVTFAACLLESRSVFLQPWQEVLLYVFSLVLQPQVGWIITRSSLGPSMFYFRP